MSTSNVVATKRIRDGFKRNFKTSMIGLGVSSAIKDEGKGKDEDNSQGFLFIVMNRWRNTEVAKVLWGK